MSDPRPPAVARLLLRLVLPGSVREFVLGDLEEEFGDIACQHGERMARRWYWRQTLGSIIPGGAMRRSGHTAKGAGRLLPDSIWQDLRFAARSFGRQPLFTASALVTLALGIGATTAVFGFANAILLRPIPGVRDADRLAIVWFGQPSPRGGIRVQFVSYPNLRDLNGQLTGFERLAGYQQASAHVASTGTTPERLPAQFVTPSYFSVLGIQPVRGRTFSAEEDDPAHGGSAVAVISHRLWTAMFNRAPDVLGRTLQINARPFSIIGVLPEGFRGTERFGETDVWLPGSTYPYVNHMPPAYSYADRADGAYYEFLARLAPKATWEGAEAELRAASARLAQLHPGVNDDFTEVRPFVFRGVGVMPLGREGIVSTVRILFGIVGLLLLIACANVVNLLLVRGAWRRGEQAIRTALGATRRRLVRQHFTETILLWFAGGLAGLAVAWGIVQLLEGTMVTASPVRQITIDWRVAGFALLASLLTGSISGMLPALLTPQVDLTGSLRERAGSEGGGRSYLRSGLTILQLAATLPLLVGALLFIRTLQELSRVDLGFDPGTVNAATVDVEDQGYSETEAAGYYRSFVERLEAAPGIAAAAVSTGAPFSCCGRYTRVGPEGAAEDAAIESLWYEATSGFRDVLRVPLLRGRWFTPAEVLPPEVRTEGVAVVSAGLAEQLFGNENPIGRYLTYPVMGREGHRVRIVGVVDDVRWTSLDGPIEPIVFEPLGQTGRVPGEAYVLARTRSNQAVAPFMRRVARALDPSLPITPRGTLAEAVKDDLSSRRAFADLLTLLGVLAVTFASVGLHGVVAFAVAARTREFGVRMAMGADSRSILGLVLRRGLVLVGLGAAIGLGGAWALSKIVESRLFGVAALDPASYLTATLLLVGVGIVAMLTPARRATRVDPMGALRSE